MTDRECSGKGMHTDGLRNGEVKNKEYQNEKFHRGLFDLIGYMLTSARGLVDEPHLYGPFRLIEGVSILCGLMEKDPGGYGDFFTKLKAKIDSAKNTVMTDEESFVGLMDELVLDFTRKMKKT
jgi:hypothetical protein